MLFPDQDSSSAFAMFPGPVRDRERSIDRQGGRRWVADRYRSDFYSRGWWEKKGWSRGKKKTERELSGKDVKRVKNEAWDEAPGFRWAWGKDWRFKVWFDMNLISLSFVLLQYQYTCCFKYFLRMWHVAMNAPNTQYLAASAAERCQNGIQWKL